MTTISEERADDIGLRERKKQHTRAAIHEAAFRLIDEQGLEATTVEQICQEADVSTRTFFNYYPSKAAAALELPGTGIESEIAQQFRAAEGGLVAALCDVVGGSAELGPSHVRMKQLVGRRPELLTTMTTMMVEVRGKFIALAAERASSHEQAELAVTLVMAALARVMHDERGADVPLAQRLRETVDQLVEVSGEQLPPAGGLTPQ
ncbi:MAG TPA: helix-turn-helix domain-containing protein [Galbitalea sp.]|jgi:AcrR family transcriptional regulator